MSTNASAERDSGRVVITGAGWVTPLGADVPSVWTKLLAGHSAIGPVTHFPADSFATSFAAEVKGFSIEHFLARHERYASAHIGSRYALAAAAQAWKQAGFADISTPTGADDPLPAVDPARVGVYLGAGEGTPDFLNFADVALAARGVDRADIDPTVWIDRASDRLTPAGELEQDPHMAVSHLADALGAQGPSFNCMTACAASTQSVGEAFEIIARGDADVMVAGGAHSMIHPFGMTGFIRLTAMSTRTDEPSSASRPFDRSRDGFVMGEGAGVLVLESLEHAIKRGATPLVEVAGFGSSADAYRITDIEPDGLGAVAAMREALGQAGIDPAAPDAQGRPPVQYISAHGTGTQENDAIETKAVRTAFADQAPRIPFSSVKSMMGHLIQAAGAVELITCVQAIRTGFAPPTINLHDPDDACDLDYVPNTARDMREHGGIDVALSNGFGFGGQNNALIVKRFVA